MKFKDMPYTRVDFEQVKEELKQLMEALKAAKDGEEQFEIHKKFYKLNDRVQTQVPCALSAIPWTPRMLFTKKSRTIMTDRCRSILSFVWIIRSFYLNLPIAKHWKRKLEK